MRLDSRGINGFTSGLLQWLLVGSADTDLKIGTNLIDKSRSR
ncbi:hypothetical protein ACYFX5_08515 [Bremerella sp. T1]|nr:hypothetical protein [Bremerella volcania]